MSPNTPGLRKGENIVVHELLFLGHKLLAQGQTKNLHQDSQHVRNDKYTSVLLKKMVTDPLKENMVFGIWCSL